MRKRTDTWLIALVAVGVIVRVFFLCQYSPLYGNDAPTYAAMAEMIEAGDFSTYDGRRTPGYPLFMLLSGFNNEVMRIVQYIAGIVSLILAYKILAFVVPRKYCFIFSACMAVSLQYPFYESIIQTEALALLLILGSLYFVVLSTEGNWRMLIPAGLLGGIGALVRPHLVILIPSYAIAYVFITRQHVMHALKGFMILCISFLFFVGGWAVFNWITLNRLTLTTLPKADLVAHMIEYVPEADDSYGEIKTAFVDSYNDKKDLVAQADDNRAGYVGYAYSLLRNRGITNRLEIASAVYLMSKDLIKKHPRAYVQSVCNAWGRFWRVHIIIYPECFTGPMWVYRLCKIIWIPMKVVWLLVNAIFVCSILVVPFMHLGKKRNAFFLLIYTVLGAASLSQALTQYYDNARFAVPFQPLVGMGVTVLCYSVLEKFQSRHQNSTLS